MPRVISSYRIHRYQQRRERCFEMNAISSDNEDIVISPRQTPRPLLQISSIITPLNDTTNLCVIEVEDSPITKNDKWGITHLIDQMLSYVLGESVSPSF